MTFSREIWLLFTKVLANVQSPNWTCFPCRQLRLAWNRVVGSNIILCGEDYIDFANTVLYVNAKITTNDGANLAADAAVGTSVSA